MSKTAFNKKGVLIGVRDLVFCKLTKDETDAHTYDAEIKQAPGVIEVAMAAQRTEDQLGANDNAYYEIMASNDGYEVSVTQASMGNDMVSFLLGSAIDANGAVIENSGDLAPYVAMGFKTARSDGSDDYVWLYKGKFGPGDSTFHTKEQGAVNWQTPVLTGMFGPRIHDANIKAVLNTKDEDAAGALAAFFETVYEKAEASG